MTNQTVNFLRRVQGTAGPIGPEHTGVEIVKFRVRRQFPLRAFRKHGQTEPEQQILQDFQIALDRLPAHLAVARDVAEVEHAAVRKTHRLQKPRKPTDVAHKALRLHLFP